MNNVTLTPAQRTFLELLILTGLSIFVLLVCWITGVDPDDIGRLAIWAVGLTLVWAVLAAVDFFLVRNKRVPFRQPPPSGKRRAATTGYKILLSAPHPHALLDRPENRRKGRRAK